MRAKDNKGADVSSPRSHGASAPFETRVVAPRKACDVVGAKTYVTKLQARIASYLAEGREREARRCAGKLLEGKAARVLAASKALSRMNLRERSTAPTLDWLVEKLGDFSVHPQVRDVLIWKGNGQFRRTCAYDVLDRARQLWIESCFGPLVTFHAHQAGVPGRGSQAIMDLIRKHLASGGCRYAIEVDIRNFFGSIDAQALRRAYGLPEWVIRNIITLERKEVVSTSRNRPGNEQDRAVHDVSCDPMWWGLPQGSSASPIFAYGLLKSVMEEFERQHQDGGMLFNYCDNFLIVAPTREALSSALSCLKRLLEEHPAGPLTLKRIGELRPLSRGCNFVGHTIRKRAGWHYITMRKDRREEFSSEMREQIGAICKCLPGSTRNARISELADRVTGTFAAYTAATVDLFPLFDSLVRLCRPVRDDLRIRRMLRTLAKLLLRQPEVSPAPRVPVVRARCSFRVASDLLSVPKGWTIRRKAPFRFAKTAADYLRKGAMLRTGSMIGGS